MKTNLTLFLMLLMCPIFFYGQSLHTVSGVITEATGEGVPYINVLLLQSNDSTFVKGTVTLENGRYQLENIKKGTYIIMGSMVGFQSAYSEPFDLITDYKAETLVLSEGEALDEVVVEATKPLYQQKVDRMVINVENSIVSAGGSALEILERSPGVLVDRQSSSISVVGKSGVVVMINGKRSYLPASAVVQLLDGMSADNIESIELITTPPAKFDAEGNAGFINIVMKERTDAGLNGSYSLNYGVGGNGYSTSNNINFNYRKDKLNIFGNYSFRNRAMDMPFIFEQEREVDNTILTTSTINNRFPKRPVSNARLGFDYKVSEKTFMGLILNGYDSQWSMDAFTDNFSAENGLPTSFAEIDLDEVNHWKHFGSNYNFKHDFTENKFISFDIDYLYYIDRNPINYQNTFFDENHNFTYDDSTRSRKLTPIERWVSRFDFSDQINENTKFEAGIKGAISTFDNAVSVENFENNEWAVDASLTSNSELAEDIYGAYVALDYVFNDKWSSKFGLRYEYTDSKLDTDTEGTVVDRQYGKFFPTAYLNRKFSDDLNMNFSYSLRITRPSFNEMAPFVILVDPNTFISGSIDIQPATSNSIKYDINYKSTIFSLQYTHEDSSIARFQITYDELNDRIIMKSENLDYIKTFSATIGLPIKISNWWRTQNNFIYTMRDVGVFRNDETTNFTLGDFSLNSTSSFKLSDSFSGEITAFYRGPRYNGSTKSEKLYRLDLGIQKKIGDNWGSLRFGVNDVFDSFVFKGVTDLPDQNLKRTMKLKFSHRTFSLTYSKSFGNNKLKSTRKSESGSAEERRRVNN
jgi:hypothetical protein